MATRDILLRLDETMYDRLKAKAEAVFPSSNGKGGGVAHYLRALVYRDLGEPEPPPYAETSGPRKVSGSRPAICLLCRQPLDATVVHCPRCGWTVLDLSADADIRLPATARCPLHGVTAQAHWDARRRILFCWCSGDPDDPEGPLSHTLKLAWMDDHVEAIDERLCDPHRPVLLRLRWDNRLQEWRAFVESYDGSRLAHHIPLSYLAPVKEYAGHRKSDMSQPFLTPLIRRYGPNLLVEPYIPDP